MQSQNIYSTERPASGSAEINAQLFLINSLLAKVRTNQVVRVVACTNDGGASPIGMVDIQPLVSMVDATGNAYPHRTIYNVPYLRIQGGTNAVILDPEVGDIGVASICDRDISTVKSTQDAAAPASNRQFNFSDAVYLATILSQQAPTNYVSFNLGGIQVISPGQITIQAPKISSNGAWSHTGSITVSDDVTASNVSLVQHVHAGVTAGASDTSSPIPG